MRRTAEESEKTRERILDVSLKVFGQKGYGQTKLSDIAKEAGITRGAIYHHFTNKSELFTALLERYNTKIFQIIQPYVTSQKDTVERIKGGFKDYFILLEKDIGMLEFQKLQFLKQELLSSSLEFDTCKNNVYEHFERIQEVILEGQRKGEIRKNIDPQEFTFFLMGFLFGIINNWLFFGKPFALSETGTRYLDQFIEFHLKAVS
ncbi:MAG: TetR family transcriptional regulator [Candidatus Marinimicrobia bacterium]|nr:TetR family transcriptional regulator [Candidatus Neomarinimicrobiota bacterium]